MKKRARFYLYILMLLFLLGIGTVILFTAPREATASAAENRMLAAFPELNGKTFFDGSFASGFEDYLSDRFPFRDTWNGTVEKILDAGSLLSDEKELRLTNLLATAGEAEDPDEFIGLLDGEGDAVTPELSFTEEERTDTATEEPVAVTEERILSPEAEEAGQTAPAVTAAGGTEPKGDGASAKEDARPAGKAEETAEDGGESLKEQFTRERLRADKDGTVTTVELIRNDGTPEEIYSYRNPRIRMTAILLNRLSKLIPEDGEVYFAYIPRGEFVKQYALGQDRYSAIRSNVEAYIRPLVNDRVQVFNATEILDPHIRAGEYVFFKTDLHWTPLGAWYVHKEMIESRGIRAVPYEDNGWTDLEEHYRGDIVRLQGLVGRDEYDTIPLVDPAVPYDFYTVTGLTKLTPRELYQTGPGGGGYSGYLGGNRGPWRLFRTYENHGRKALLVADSMGNVFAPLLLAYYDEVHYICPKGGGSFDVGKAGGTVKKFIDTYGIDDVYVISTNILGGESYRDCLHMYMGD